MDLIFKIIFIQIDVADKQIKIFKKFLDEQAAERETERDEFMNEIERLTNALKIKEKDSSLQERTNQEVGLILIFFVAIREL